VTGIAGFTVIDDAGLHSVTIRIRNKKRYQKKGIISSGQVLWRVLSRPFFAGSSHHLS
jgi:hypothetical protein